MRCDWSNDCWCLMLKLSRNHVCLGVFVRRVCFWCQTFWYQTHLVREVGTWYLFSGILPVQISRTCVIGIADLCGACLVWHVRFHNVFPMTPSVSEPFANRRRSPVFMTQQITSAAASVMWSVCRGVLLTGTHFTNRLGYFTFWISLFAQRICCVYSHASRSNFILIVVGIY